MHRKFLESVLVGFVFGAGSWAAQGQPTAVPAVAPSQILTTEGKTVEVALAGSLDWHRARINEYLHWGDRLRTGQDSRAMVRLSDQSVLRIRELTTLQIFPPRTADKKPLLDLKNGSVYFFSREKPADVEFSTPTASGAIRGTEFQLQAGENGLTLLALLEGEVELRNDLGQITLHSGELGNVERGRGPTKTALLNALNIIQWCLYYPGVLHAEELNLSDAEKEHYRQALAAYRSGELLLALAEFPEDQPPASDAARTFAAALQLSVGHVEKARGLLAGLAAASPLADALQETVAAVQFQPWTRAAPPSLASEWLAESYYLQSRSRLEEALKAARAAVARSPSFGFGWVRLAELEFGFGRTTEALSALEKGLQLAPRNPQALALKGFFLSARNRTKEALGWFDQALAVDGALGHAWLGRGLCRIQQGETEEGRKDLQVAAALEPQRGLLRSYLGKAFVSTRQDQLAEKELALARKLDPNDPTAWLYSALFNQQRNRINEAIHDLEKSRELNDNRRLYRSQLLLDQDRAVRSANLASLYKDAGLFDVSVREAARAVSYDYANHSAHLFLAESYDALRDPKQINLRYETTRISELLMANLLAPVGGGNLSQNISQQDYGRLFATDRLGVSSSTEYFSSGDWIQSGAHYGTFGNTSYALDSYYLRQNGHRPNNDLDQLNLSAQFKQQVGPQDSVYFQALYYNGESGDVRQYYNQHGAIANVPSPSLGLRAIEKQEPNLFLGVHHEWNPGSHTLFLGGRLEDTLDLQDPAPKLLFLRPLVIQTTPPPLPNFKSRYRRSFEAYSTELQQLWQSPSQTLILGGRYQAGTVDAFSELARATTVFHLPDGSTRPNSFAQDLSAPLERLDFYAYHQWQILEALRLSTGLGYDRLRFPRNLDVPPLTGGEEEKDQISPKAGLLYAPGKNTTFRALYTQSLGGLFYDNSIRLEPTQVAGFNQAFRSILPESAVGLLPGAEFETWSAGVDHAFQSRTYAGVEAELLSSEGQRTLGVMTNFAGGLPLADTPSSTRQSLDFEEKSIVFTLNQLLGKEWSLGARYRLSEARLTGRFIDVPPGVIGLSSFNQDNTATLQQLNLFLIYNHPGGFFSQVQSHWTAQSNQGYNPGLPGDSFWQHHFFVGYRFPRRLAEIRLGLLNLTGRDYLLNPLNLHAELPRERTLTASLKLNF
ncbi:MAG: FecR domain-containing protein [Verrucomicrobiota bacterium]